MPTRHNGRSTSRCYGAQHSELLHNLLVCCDPISTTEVPVWVKTSKSQNEHMFSGLPPIAALQLAAGGHARMWTTSVPLNGIFCALRRGAHGATSWAASAHTPPAIITSFAGNWSGSGTRVCMQSLSLTTRCAYGQYIHCPWAVWTCIVANKEQLTCRARRLVVIQLASSGYDRRFNLLMP
jgi:hypothetical protein